MGAAASKQDTAPPKPAAPAETASDDKQAHPLQFGRSLLNSLDKTHVEGPSADRQATLDSSVQQRIKSELDRLRKEEAEVRSQIEKAIEKENLERESKHSGAEGKNSNVLRQELDEVRKKIERHRQKSDISAYAGVKEAQEQLVKCYKSQPERTLDCWKEAEDFKAAVAKAEKEFIASFN
ncbi:uncharacterized protein PFL1_01380 [Pseudozyma flocculosa PF-1]|uniref:MICOS complex subunit mic19 n=1 Tax=Pseudozyma flocculosa TaxID=84751 RepID=A0A5C3EW91_9BASI|nr:uncharacterized protein PFL1_01380 [Pseudozyma flocculosa PF-1]EPQ31192.1 hypothetical protein PFL1_01380 [Pseudozyma flocculosa PF-1]SPO36312.1 uncharacterized protein PSFLO_01783 [Pseudozyma flocculosa]